MLHRLALALPLCCCLVGLQACSAQGPTYASLEDAQADPDFKLQGEYKGEGRGMQVIALGGGKFRAVDFEGGLPGDGWNGAERQLTEGDWATIEPLLAGLDKVDRKSPTLGAAPPENAIVLFDGTKETFKKRWKEGARISDDGLLEQGAVSVDAFEDFTLHLEFRLPYMPEARGQARGNSGCYVQGRYEVQMLDSFGLDGQDNECGGVYQAAAPAVNMCFPPLAWQTYDIEFTAAKFGSDGKKTSNARMKVVHNGTVIHEDLELDHPTPLGVLPGESAESGPIFLQDHGNPVRYQNIWVQPR